MSQLITIFPTSVFKTNYNREFDANEKFTFDSYEKTSTENTGNKITPDHNVLGNSNSLSNLKQFFNKSINDYVRNAYNPTAELDVYITESWINYTYPGQHHHLHYHPNSFISGVFYYNTIPNDGLVFVKTVKGMFEIEPKEYNYLNSDSWSLPVINGDLLLFPSTLQHQVDKNKSNDVRISLSFNTFIKGDISKLKASALTV